MMGVEEMLSYFPAVLAAGAAYGGVKAGLNGTRDTLAQIERIVSRLDEKVDAHGERISKVEERTEQLQSRLSGRGG